ncbi:Ger(x)C family spore germination protein [Neobacillus rhizosphaerae]|uniref:Ger(x)C family spore germination protein n=1 Tax=Neobacillus rhizosphaerae TaxID=2880965 RepID=UPI003D2D3AD2
MRNFLFVTSLMVFLTGCANIREIQYQAYAVGIGIDYKDHEYHVVLQFLDFSNVAKTDQGKSDRPVPVWLGTGKGKTVEDAIIQIYHGIQIPINYDQISLFVFGKSLLEHRLGKTLKSLDTNFNIRQTGLAYGTEEKVEKIFTTKVPFNYAYSNSRINQPEFMQQQDSSVPTISLQELIFQFNEKTKTIVLPRITINEKIVKQNLEYLPVNIFDGAYILKDEKLKGYLSQQNLEGFIRVNNKAVRSPVIVGEETDGKEELVQIELLKPKVKRVIDKDKNEVNIGLDINISAIIREATKKEVLSPRVKRKIKEKITNEVYAAYLKSHQIGGDIYQFEDFMYRFMYEDWKTTKKKDDFPVLKKENIHVKVRPLKSINKINSGIKLPLE